MTYGITDLQLSLIVIGVLSVGGVWGYNVWQERKHRKAAQELFGVTRKDVLLEQAGSDETVSAVGAGSEDALADERIEPVIVEKATLPPLENEEATTVEAISSGEPEGRAEEFDAQRAPEEAVPLPLPGADDLPVLAEDAIVRHSPLPEVATADEAAVPLPDGAARAEDTENTEGLGGATAENAPPLELADPVIDCVVQIHAGEMISAPLLWAGQRQLFGRLAGRLCWIGLDENTGHWQRLHVHDPNSYRRLLAALQLADRNGPVAADDVALFCDGVRQLAAHYHAQAIVPVVSEVMARAHSLDAFCASVDWRLVMHLAARGEQGRGLLVDDIGQLAAVAGLQKSSVRESDDLHALDPQGQTQFTLGLPAKVLTAAGDEEAGHEVARVVLTLDVPRVTDGVAAFDRMIHLAQVLSTRLNAVLVDDRGKLLGPEVPGLIREKIAEFQQKMAGHQIPAGSRRALRLYS